MLWYFQMHSKGTQSYVYMYPPLPPQNPLPSKVPYDTET